MKEKGVTEDEVVVWYHRLHGPEFEQTLADSKTGKPGLLQSTGSKRVRRD